MKKNTYMLSVFIVIFLFIAGCGSSSSNKVQDKNPNDALINSVKAQFIKEGFTIIDGLTIESPDKSISVTFPDNYVIVTKPEKGFEGVQYLGVHLKINDGISVIFAPAPKSPFRYNQDDKSIESKQKIFDKNNPKLEGTFNSRKINNNWFLVTQMKDGTVSYSTTGNKETEVEVTTKLLKSDLMKVVESIKFH